MASLREAQPALMITIRLKCCPTTSRLADQSQDNRQAHSFWLQQHEGPSDLSEVLQTHFQARYEC